jgi:nicotinamidase-related amidase
MNYQRTLLLTLDYINGIMHPDGKFASCAKMATEQKIIAKANQALAWARKNKVHIAHVKVGFPENYANCPKQSPVFGDLPARKGLILGTWETEFHADLDVRPEDSIITKHRISAFYNTNLETLLRANQIETLILCGVSTNYAVEMTAREAHDRDYQVITLKDACAANTPESHEQAFAIALGRLSTVIKVAELA